MRSTRPSPSHAYSNLAGLLDWMGEGFILCNSAGRLLHTTPALERLLEADGNRDLLRRGLSRMLGTLVRMTGDRSQSPAGRDVFTAAGRYCVRGTRMSAGAAGRVLVVTLERVTGRILSPRLLQWRYGLTSQEVEIAQLLARGQSNIAIAASLGISPRTAEHHTQRVLRKLGVRSRGAVGPRLRGDS